ncbi:phosphomannomutase/phosphoglucomutase [bacterium]|nr:phosphomannomutase/phosphoglucomutase [bacterium]
MEHLEDIDISIFKAYDIRGIYPSQLNEQLASLIAQAYLKMVSEKLGKEIKELKIAVCRDNRHSSDPLMDEVTKVFLKYGVSVNDLGLLSINDYYFAVGKYKYDGGIMATASHNPPEYGGFKMTIKNTEYKDSIEFISGKELFQVIKDLDFPINAEELAGQQNTKDVLDEHLKHILSFVDLKKIKPLKVVVDTGGGMTAMMIPQIFEKLPCQLTHIFAELDSDFKGRAPNPLIKGAHDVLTKNILEIKADLGVIFDVDGDRMFLVDEKGKLVKGDMVLLILAKAILAKNPGAGIAYNLICSHAVKDLVKEWGGKPIRSEVGYRNLARHMREEGGIMSGEVSGHFAFSQNYYADSGFIAMVLALQAISLDGRPLSEIIEDFHLYEKSEELNFIVDDRDIELAKFREAYRKNILDEIDGITVEYEDWWFNVRPSNTEPLIRLTVEAKNKKLLGEKIKELESLIDFKERKQ